MPYVLGFLVRRPWRAVRLALALPACIGFACGLVSRGALKSVIVRAAFGGVARADIERWNAHYVPRLIADGLFPEALQAIATHRASGDTLVLMSASPDLYVPEVGRRLAFAHVTCTGIAWRDDRVDGHLTTENCRGEEKTRRLEALKREHPGMPVSAYGNSGSDLPHMRLADAAVLVNGNSASREAAAATGTMRAVDWR